MNPGPSNESRRNGTGNGTGTSTTGGKKSSKKSGKSKGREMLGKSSTSKSPSRPHATNDCFHFDLSFNQSKSTTLSNLLVSDPLLPLPLPLLRAQLHPISSQFSIHLSPLLRPLRLLLVRLNLANLQIRRRTIHVWLGWLNLSWFK
jgi:hypothetical protein